MIHEDFIDGAPIAEPHVFIQWKGTRVCLDWTCACGVQNHVDDDFAYHVECPTCLARYEVGCHIRLRPTAETPETSAFAHSFRASGEAS